MNKSVFLAILWLICSLLLSAQDKQLTLRDAVYLNPEILPKRLNQIQWMGSVDYFSYVEDDKLIQCSATTEERRTIASLDDLNAGLADLEIDSIQRFPQITFSSDNQFWFFHSNSLFLFHTTSKNLSLINRIADKAENTDVNELTYRVAFTLGNNLYVAINQEQFQVTDDENKGIVNGQVVHRNEFGISKGTFWSPQGNYLAFYRKDETMVADYPLVNIEPRIAEAEFIKYPMAGMASEHVTLGIYDIKTRKTIFVRTGEPEEQYLTNISWDPGEEYIYIAILNRDQDHMKLNKYNIKTGDYVSTLFEEKNEKYVEPEHPMVFLKTQPDRFIWLSERNGWQHMYLYNTRGEIIKQLTDGEWTVVELAGFAAREKFAYFIATKESPIEQHIYSCEIATGKIIRLSPDHGSHSALVSGSGKYIIDNYSSTDVAREYKLLDNKGKTLQILKKNEDPLKDFNLGSMSIFTLKADDGKDLYCRIIKPSGFDPEKKYPVYFYVYGGPHSQLVSDSWLGAAGLFQNFMAQQGYVVFTMDNRGTANRGLAFEQSIFRNLGTIEVADQMKGVEYLKSLSFVDQNKIGLDGWSYGGFMVISMLLKNPDVFALGCAGGPVIDWKYYEVMYGERYMDRPSQNPDGYNNASLINYVSKLEDKLLIFHGTDDATVVWQNSLSFIKACIDEGKQVDYFVYPGHPHNVRGKDRMHLYGKIMSYFYENMKEID